MKKGWLPICLIAPLLFTGCKHASDETNPWVMSHSEYQLLYKKGEGVLPGNLSHIEHIALFKLKASVTPSEKTMITQHFLALKNATREGKPYIKNIKYGYQNSREGLSHDYDLGFVVTFSNENDRDFYVGNAADTKVPFDQQHALFKAYVTPFVEDVLVFDFKMHG